MNNLLEDNIIRLRAPEPEDLEALYVWENETSLWPSGSTIAPLSRYTLKQYLSESKHDIYTDKQLRLMVELKQTETAIGTADLYDFDPFHRRAGIGILIDRNHRRQGLGLKALQLLEAYAFNFLNLHQLYALVSKNNLTSIRLFNKAGYTVSGELTHWLSTEEGYEDVKIFQKIDC